MINAINNISLITHSLLVQKAQKASIKSGMEYKEPAMPVLLKESDEGLMDALRHRLEDASNHVADLIAVQEEMFNQPGLKEEFESSKFNPKRPGN